MHTEAHPLARRTVQFRGDHRMQHNTMGDVTDLPFEIEDWQDRLFGKSWMDCEGNPACLVYAMRAAFAELPVDDEVVYGKVDGLGMIVHVSELGDVVEDQPLGPPPRSGRM